VSEAATAGAAPEEEAGERVLCVLFRRGEDRYAVRADEVHKVTEPGWMNRLPRLPRSVIGITQHRGRIVTVVDLAELFAAEEPPPRSHGSGARVLILERGQRHLGVWVDAVEQIANIRFPSDAGGVALLSHGGEALSALDAGSLVRRVLGLGGPEEG
jgi:purine-binding chemotaxis protein CheW